MPNRLAAEKSPYLLQHKDNPVDWYPWGPEAFAKAKAEDKPLLLSIGYSTCHWCHVMERESFVDPNTAAVMNASFVCVKLDREERPDVDKLYMTAVQAMTGQGGWPLNCFLTPDLKPFFGGTYFPPEQRWGQPSWTGLLGRVAELWRERRKEIEADATKLAAAVTDFVSAEGARAKPGAAVLAAAVAADAAAYDARRGGFGGAPKFPLPSNPRFLLRRHARTGEPAARDMAVTTLRAMTRGGIFDQLGGGYARYSTDADWRVPHFEKMLYDNAQLLSLLADARALTADAELEAALRRTADYLSRDLRHPDGGFYSAEDADSLPPGAPADAHGEEGAFYLWTTAELDAALGADTDAFKARYGVVPEGNAIADPHGEFVGKCVLYDKSPEALSEAKAAPLRAKLLALRATRPRPSRDEKILTSWNGLAIGGLARAHAVLGDPEHLRLADKATDFLRARLRRADGTLWHRWADGQAAVPGLADDYAFLLSGLLDLYEASFAPERLAWAVELAEKALTLFALPGGGVAMTAAGDGTELFARPVEDHDGVEPSAGAVLADSCLRLFEITGRDEFRRFADETLERFGPRLEERPQSMPYLLGALDRALGPSRLLVIAGLDLPGGPELLAAARTGFRPAMTVAAFGARERAALAALVPAVADMKPAARAAAYLCSGGACGLPVTDAAELARRLGEK